MSCKLLSQLVLVIDWSTTGFAGVANRKKKSQYIHISRMSWVTGGGVVIHNNGSL